MSNIIFETPRLIARQLGSADLADMLEVYGDENAMRWVGDGQPITREGVITWLDVTADNYCKRGYGMSALVLRESGEIVGFCGLVHPGGQPEAEIKYALKRAYWGRGIATEAAAAMLAYGRQRHGLSYIMATTAPDNVASHRVLVKAGMIRGQLELNEDGSSTQVFEWHAQ